MKSPHPFPLLNPASSYHLSMKMDYPNAVDDARHARHTRLAGRRWSQGGDIFIHGKCASVGCIATLAADRMHSIAHAALFSAQQLTASLITYDPMAQPGVRLG